MVRHWLITGGLGFIGSNLINSLLQDPFNKIYIVDNHSIFSPSIIDPVAHRYSADEYKDRVEIYNFDIADSEAALHFTKGIDIVVHLAANTGVGPSVENPRLDCMNNVVGTFNYLEASRVNNVKKFIFASSGAPVGECTPPIHEELAPHPVSPYGASKLSGEGYCSAFYHSYGLQTISLRFSNVYGPYSLHKQSVVAKYIKAGILGQPVQVFGDGAQTRDYIYIDDLIHALLLASVKTDVGGNIFQIATNKETSINELIGLLNSLFKDKNICELDVKYSGFRTGDVKRNYSNINKARLMLGWKPQVNILDGLRQTLEWYLAKMPK